MRLVNCATYIVLAALSPSLALSAPQVDLSGLGKAKPVQTQVTNDSGIIEEEVISSKVYSSDGTSPSVRRKVEMVKPNKTQLKLSKPKKENKSMFEFVDKALGIKPVKPWEKGTLAKKEMKPGGPVPEFDLFSEKVFAYKQGSVGGSGVGGGGCGCN